MHVSTCFKAVLQRDLSDEVDPLLGNLSKPMSVLRMRLPETTISISSKCTKWRKVGMHFGGIVANHPCFDWIDAKRGQRRKASAEFLQKIESEPWAFAFPYGGLAEDAPQILKSHGFIAAFTTKTQLQHTDPFLIGRLDGEEVAQNGHSYA